MYPTYRAIWAVHQNEAFGDKVTWVSSCCLCYFCWRWVAFVAVRSKRSLVLAGAGGNPCSPHPPGLQLLLLLLLLVIGGGDIDGCVCRLMTIIEVVDVQDLMKAFVSCLCWRGGVFFFLCLVGMWEERFRSQDVHRCFMPIRVFSFFLWWSYSVFFLYAPLPVRHQHTSVIWISWFYPGLLRSLAVVCSLALRFEKK